MNNKNECFTLRLNVYMYICKDTCIYVLNNSGYVRLIQLMSPSEMLIKHRCVQTCLTGHNKYTVIVVLYNDEKSVICLYVVKFTSV